MTNNAEPNSTLNPYITAHRPAEFNPDRELDWFKHGPEIASDASRAEQRSFVADMIHRFLPETPNKNRRYRVQDGLEYEVAIESIIEDFVFGITDWHIHGYQESVSTFDQTLRVDVDAETMDTAKFAPEVLSDSNDQIQMQTAPGPENWTFVECYLSARVNITAFGFNSSLRIRVIQEQSQRESTNEST